jgi:transposase, IS6 family
VEELLAERGVVVEPLLAEAAQPCRHAVGHRWQLDETYVKVAGQWALRLPDD